MPFSIFPTGLVDFFMRIVVLGRDNSTIYWWSEFRILITLAIEEQRTNPRRIFQPTGRCWTMNAGLRKAWSWIRLEKRSWGRHYQNECLLKLWMHTFYSSLSTFTFRGFRSPMDMSCEEQWGQFCTNFEYSWSSYHIQLNTRTSPWVWRSHHSAPHPKMFKTQEHRETTDKLRIGQALGRAAKGVY
jgi:hypothetical protein